MQTKLVILASVTGGVSALSFSTSQNTLLSLSTALIASVLYLAAFLSKDKKDKQIEEIHQTTTELRAQNKPESAIDPIPISEKFLENQHNLIFSKFDEDSHMLRTSLMLKGRFNGSSGMNQFCALIVSYSSQFLKDVESRAIKIHGSNVFLSPQVKAHLERYLEADVIFLKEKLEAVFPSRIGSTPMTNAKRDGESKLRNLYAQFLLNMFEDVA